MSDNIALITFTEGWAENGVGKDGLPLYRPVVHIIKSVPPYTQVTYVATDADFAEFPLQYELFRKQHKARAPDVEGYPLAMWPVVTPAEFQMCATRDIFTVEQLAALTKRAPGWSGAPPQIIELAKRAAKLIDLQGSVGKFEAVISQLTAEREQLVGELKEANATISAQTSLINQLRPKAA
jgi:hypothetical protein